jgi:hypothetical protein
LLTCLRASTDLEPKHEGKIDSAFIKANKKIHLIRIEARLRQSGHWTEKRSDVEDDIRRLVDTRIGAIDWKQAGFRLDEPNS